MRRGFIGLGALLALTVAGAGIARSESSQPTSPTSTAQSSTESTAPSSDEGPRIQLASYSVTGNGSRLDVGTIQSERLQQRRDQARLTRTEAKRRAKVKLAKAIAKAKAEQRYYDAVARRKALEAEQERQAEAARQAEAEAEAQAEAAAPAPAQNYAGGGMGGGWAALRQCESGGNYGAVSSSGQYRGAYQFSQSTWNSVASSVDPGLVGVDPASASPGAQDAMAQALYNSSGSSPWPVCGRHL